MSSLEDNIQGLRRVVSSITGLTLSNVILDFANRRSSQNPEGLYCVVTRRKITSLGMPEVYEDIQQEVEIAYDLSFIGTDAINVSYAMLGGQFDYETQDIMRTLSIGFKKLAMSNSTSSVGEDTTYIESSVVECLIWATLVNSSTYNHIDSLNGLNVTDENNNPIG